MGRFALPHHEVQRDTGLLGGYSQLRHPLGKFPSATLGQIRRANLVFQILHHRKHRSQPDATLTRDVESQVFGTAIKFGMFRDQ